MIVLDVKKNFRTSHPDFYLDINIRIESGKSVAFFGRSGSGKTSVLKMIAGLLEPDSGIISWKKDLWFDSKKKINLPPQKRKIGYVFQENSLFPNMTVLKNLKFGIPRSGNQNLLTEIISFMKIESLLNRFPVKLSGGERQKVSLGRALLCQPEILLLDEPFSSLDLETRESMRDLVLQLRKRFAFTLILVSHDREDLSKISDKIFHISNGKISSKI